MPGDYNRDGDVDAADYTAYRDSLRQSVNPFSGADGNGDGLVAEADYQLWRENFGAEQPATLVITRELRELQRVKMPSPISGFQLLVLDYLTFDLPPKESFILNDFDEIQLRLATPVGQKLVVDGATPYGIPGFTFGLTARSATSTGLFEIPVGVEFVAVAGQPPQIEAVGDALDISVRLRTRATDIATAFEFTEVVLSWDISSIEATRQSRSHELFGNGTGNKLRIAFSRLVSNGDAAPGQVVSLVPLNEASVSGGAGDPSPLPASNVAPVDPLRSERAFRQPSRLKREPGPIETPTVRPVYRLASDDEHEQRTRPRHNDSDWLVGDSRESAFAELAEEFADEALPRSLSRTLFQSRCRMNL